MSRDFSESSSRLESELTDRQRYWLEHIRAAEQRGEPVKSYAKRLGLASSSMYEAKRRLRGLGVLDAAPMSPVCSQYSSATPVELFTAVHAVDQAASRQRYRW
jgi:hypothetical protein